MLIFAQASLKFYEESLVYYFLRSWKESIALFAPKQFKLFCLVTLKSIFESYKLIILHFGWLFALSALLDLSYSQFCLNLSYLCLLPLVGWFITIFGMYLIIRPSIKRKGWNYYKDNWLKFFYFIFFSIIAYSIPIAMLAAANKIVYLTQHIHTLFYYLLLPVLLIPILVTFLMPPNLIVLYVSPLLTFLILFILDGDGSIKNVLKSVVRALKMMIYNYPFCILIFILFVICSVSYTVLIANLFGVDSFLLSPIVSNAFLPIPLCILTNFYVKRLHEQFGLYYPETVKE